MKRLLSVFLGAMLAVAGIASSMPSFAAEPEVEEEGVSAYSVARIKIFQGTAWIRSPDSGEWEETTTNTPITDRTRVHVPEGSEAELQFHGGQYVLLTGGTEIDVRKFDDANSVFRLRSGEIRFDLPAEDFSPVGVTVPGGGKADFNVPGRYWFFVRDEGQTRLVVRSGEGTVTTAKGAYGVKAGQEAAIGQDVRISAYAGQAEPEAAPPAPLSEEERQANVPPAAAYELRDYGEWVESADYGWVWRPQVVDGWSPYYYGRWVWVSPYGWTWVSYEPWGWYPYHFGWWAIDPFFGWVWSPFHSFVSVSFVFGHTHFAHFHRNAFFFPANVRFVRDGRNVRFVPLRPGERFVRSGLTRSDTRLSRFNRPLDRGSVFVRTTDRGGKSAWREWSSTRGDRRTVQVRERSGRSGERGFVRSGTDREERSTFRPERERSGSDRQERMAPRGPDRQDRGPRRDMRGGRGSGRDDGREMSSVRRPGPESAVRSQRMGPSRYERAERGGPARRMEPPARVRERREAPYFGGRDRSPAPPAYSPRYGSPSGTPGRVYRQPDRGAPARAPEMRGPSGAQGFRSRGSEGASRGSRGGGGEGFRFGGGERGSGWGGRGGDFGGGRR